MPAETELCGRRALQGYLTLGLEGVSSVEKTLWLLIQICHSCRDLEDEEASVAMLAFVQREAPNQAEVRIQMQMLAHLSRLPG